MPLLDHFHPPLSSRRGWESFHALWTASLTTALNTTILPDAYHAEAQIHIGGKVEVDVATLEMEPISSGLFEGFSGGGTATAVLEPKVWAPPDPDYEIPAVFPDDIEVHVFLTCEGKTLVAAIELVSPGNKDRPETRTAFASKCAAYLQRGIGLVVIDVVTDRLANLHDELMDLLDRDVPRLASRTELYAVAYRPARRKVGDRIDCWTMPLSLSYVLPVVPLALRGGPTLPVDLEVTYSEARRMSRL